MSRKKFSLLLFWADAASITTFAIVLDFVFEIIRFSCKISADLIVD